MNVSKKQLIRYGVNILSVIGFIVIIYFFYWGYQQNIFSSEEALQDFLETLGPIAPYGFTVIQIIQVVIPIIPGALTIPMGAMVFGMGQGFILNFIGVGLGSIINFGLGRKYGRSFLDFIVSERQFDKYLEWLEDAERYKKIFTYAMFFPLSPDDLLCYLTGLSTVSLKRFLIVLILSKPVTILVYSYGMIPVLDFIFQFFV